MSEGYTPEEVLDFLRKYEDESNKLAPVRSIYAEAANCIEELILERNRLRVTIHEMKYPHAIYGN